MQFLDEVKIYIKSGDGGSGSIAFLREKFMPMGGPSGGNGGRGGSVILQAKDNLNTLIDFRYKQHFKAKNGEAGKGQCRDGSAAEDLILDIPVGTEILTEDKSHVIYDFTKAAEKLNIAKGGDGGFGNAHFKSSKNQAPQHKTIGWPGEEMWVWLRLKLISDAGLIGLPNAGKSTFLASITSAKAKIADYPFTTLKPQLGVVYIDEEEFVLADLPGLIAGAHQGIGLGDKFLKHVERAGVLIHLIDATQEDVVTAYQIIREELNLYGLADKKELIVLSKCDALTEDEIELKKKQLKKVTKQKIYNISAHAQINIKPLLRKVFEEIKKYREKF